MKTRYLVAIEAVLPVLATISIEAASESEAIMLAERIAESERPGVKTTALEIETYPADWLTVLGVSEITSVGPDGADGTVWTREEIQALLQPTTYTTLK